MSTLFEELDYCPTPIGPISLRRRHILSLGQDVYEVILGDEHLMSSLFTTSEIALARRGLAALEGHDLEVVVGGLGLGYTAASVLEDVRVKSLSVIEYLQPVIDWHIEKLVPLTPPLVDDPRCHLIQGDFFQLAASDDGFTPKDAILIDIDHAPDWLLNEQSKGFYTQDGLEKLARHLKPGGIMGLWSDRPEDENFVKLLKQVFTKAWAEPVTFHNPLQDRLFTQTVYFGRS